MIHFLIPRSVEAALRSVKGLRSAEGSRRVGQRRLRCCGAGVVIILPVTITGMVSLDRLEESLQAAEDSED